MIRIEVPYTGYYIGMRTKADTCPLYITEIKKNSMHKDLLGPYVIIFATVHATV